MINKICRQQSLYAPVNNVFSTNNIEDLNEITTGILHIYNDISHQLLLCIPGIPYKTFPESRYHNY